MSQGSWEHFEHEADIGLRAIAPNRGRLFELMAEALTAIITDPEGVRCIDTVTVTCEAPDDAMLLVDWLNALVFEMATRRMLFGEWRVEMRDHGLEAQIRGEPIDRPRHRPVVEVKGATYTALAVEQDEEGDWHGQCVVDV
jgi:tRNA nucleotidyltransferase (CCA-adding enzyme)